MAILPASYGRKKLGNKKNYKTLKGKSVEFSSSRSCGEMVSLYITGISYKFVYNNSVDTTQLCLFAKNSK